MLRPLSLRRAAACAAALAILAFSPAFAETGAATLINPGEKVPADLLIGQGGTAGRDLAPLIGTAPVFGVYWRPADPVSEGTLVGAFDALRRLAPGATFFPVAVLAATQRTSAVRERLDALGLKDAAVRIDGGALAGALGVRALPSFVLIDRGGVLRLIGGSDVSQANRDGVSILDALAAVSKGAAVPTIGVLSNQPAYRLLGKPLPDGAVTEQDGTTWRKLSQYLAPGKRTLVFCWLPSCSHCKATLPKLRTWFEAKRPDDLVVVDIARGDQPLMREEAVKFIEGYPFTHLIDTAGTMLQALLVTETPTVFLVDATGKVQSLRTGENINFDAWLAKAPTPAPAPR